MKNSTIKAVLFDLDGTLLDTAYDLVNVLNTMLIEHGEKAYPLAQIRNVISGGSQALQTFLPPTFSPEEKKLFIETYFSRYQNCKFQQTHLFPGSLPLLKALEQHHIPWGIVTNKLARHSEPLLKPLDWYQTCGCLVSADTLGKAKPDPAPVLYACEQLKVSPRDTLFIGDHYNDIAAGKAAGTQTGVILHGYISVHVDPYEWQADYYFSDFFNTYQQLGFD